MSEGAIQDLVSRGKKDAYFIQGAQSGLFGGRWGPRSPATREIREEYPFSPARFGHWVDIDLPRVGDMLMSADIHIKMPTWLPPSIAALNRTHYVSVANPAATGGSTSRDSRIWLDEWHREFLDISLVPLHGQHRTPTGMGGVQ